MPTWIVSVTEYFLGDDVDGLQGEEDEWAASACSSLVIIIKAWNGNSYLVRVKTQDSGKSLLKSKVFICRHIRMFQAIKRFQLL